MEETKTCNICHKEKLTTDYYMNSSRCKRCHNQKRNEWYRKTHQTVKTKKGLNFITDETKKAIRQEIDSGVPIIQAAKKYEVNYSSLCYWNRIKAF